MIDGKNRERGRVCKSNLDSHEEKNGTRYWRSHWREGEGGRWKSQWVSSEKDCKKNEREGWRGGRYNYRERKREGTNSEKPERERVLKKESQNCLTLPTFHSTIQLRHGQPWTVRFLQSDPELIDLQEELTGGASFSPLQLLSPWPLRSDKDYFGLAPAFRIDLTSKPARRLWSWQRSRTKPRCESAVTQDVFTHARDRSAAALRLFVRGLLAHASRERLSRHRAAGRCRDPLPVLRSSPEAEGLGGADRHGGGGQEAHPQHAASEHPSQRHTPGAPRRPTQRHPQAACGTGGWGRHSGDGGRRRGAGGTPRATWGAALWDHHLRWARWGMF